VIHSTNELPIVVAGGGIGGIAAALALVRRGFCVKVLEQSPQLGEIGAGIQLGPNAFAAFDALGVGPIARSRAVYTDYMVMHDAIDEYQVGCIPTGEAFRARFRNPYAVIHRADVHMSLLEGAQATGRIEIATGTCVQRVEQHENTVIVHDTKGNQHRGLALIGADGVKSAVRRQYVGDEARVSGHVVYRAVVDREDFPEDLQWNAASIWVGPNCHLVHYPLRAGEQYNVVVTFHSREKEQWSVREGSREEAVTLGEALRVHDNDFAKGCALYERSRVARTARIVLSAREMGRIFHAKGVERLVRNELWKGRTPERFYDAVEWLYGWQVENCLAA